MTLRVESETGRLRRVLVHRPGREIDWMVPSMMEELLFDDILFGRQARGEHDKFRQVLEAAGVEVLDSQDLLAEVLAESDPRAEILEDLVRSYSLRAELAERLAEVEPAHLAAVLVSGVRTTGPQSQASYRYFDLPPLPNYFFQRDPQVVLGDRVVISSMATEARAREPFLARAIFRHHPALSGYRSLISVDRPPPGAPAHDASLPKPTLEGGDVLVAGPDLLLVGISERTNRLGVELLAEHLRREEAGFRYLVMVELPHGRSYMHLDTVFTFIDEGACLAYLPVVQAGHLQSARAYRVDLEARSLAFSLAPSLLAALEEVGRTLEIVPCGGVRDAIDQDREQWTDGANAFAVAPGVILLYRRNQRTTDELASRGWRVVREEEVLSGSEPLLGRGRTVVTLQDHELSRARGGPHCMTMPLERDGDVRRVPPRGKESSHGQP